MFVSIHGFFIEVFTFIFSSMRNFDATKVHKVIMTCLTYPVKGSKRFKTKSVTTSSYEVDHSGRPDCHLHMRRLRHLRMPTSLVHARTCATSLVHAHTFLALFVGIELRIWTFGFRVLGVSGFSGWGRDYIRFA